MLILWFSPEFIKNLRNGLERVKQLTQIASTVRGSYILPAIIGFFVGAPRRWRDSSLIASTVRGSYILPAITWFYVGALPSQRDDFYFFTRSEALCEPDS